MLNATSFIACTASNQSSPEVANATVELVTLFGLGLASLGIVSNAAAFYALCRRPAMNRALHAGLLSLSVADCLIALSTTALLAYSYHWSRVGHWAVDGEAALFRREWCAFAMFRRLWSIATDANQFTLIFLAGQQFLTIRWPLKVSEGISKGKCLTVLAIMWTVSIVMGFTETAVIAAVSEGHHMLALWPEKGTTRFCYQIILYDEKVNCTDGYLHDMSQEEHDRAFATYGVCLFICDMAALSVSYGYTAMAVNRVVKAERMSHASCSAGRAAWRPDRKRVVITTSAVTLVCVVCYLPLFIYFVLTELGCSSCSDPIFFPTLMSIVSIAPILDPVIYTLRLKVVRQSFERSFDSCMHHTATPPLLQQAPSCEDPTTRCSQYMP